MGCLMPGTGKFDLSIEFQSVTGHRLVTRNDDGCFDNFFLIFPDKKSHEVATGARWGHHPDFLQFMKILNWTFLLPTKSVSCKKWPLTTSIFLCSKYKISDFRGGMLNNILKFMRGLSGALLVCFMLCLTFGARTI